jgi:hypothetical protein
VQSARQFFIKLDSVIKGIGFTQSIVEPCMLTNNTPHVLVIMVIHVDEYFVAGNSKILNYIIKAIQDTGLKIKVENTVRDYLGCEILFNQVRTKAWVGQPSIMKKII